MSSARARHGLGVRQQLSSADARMRQTVGCASRAAVNTWAEATLNRALKWVGHRLHRDMTKSSETRDKAHCFEHRLLIWTG